MQTFPQNSTLSDISTDTDIQLVTAVLESGNSVELPAEGYSMFPTLRPGNRVLVRPLNKGELPQPGSVVVFIDNGSTAQRCNGSMVKENKSFLVLHRLLEIIDDGSGNLLLITRGDSSALTDKPFPQEQLIGVAVSYKSGKKVYSLKTFIPGSWRYGFNHRLLWVYARILRLFIKLRI